MIAVTGDVTIKSKDGGRLGKKGSAVAPGETVETAAGATAVIEIPDGSRLKLRESSSLAVTLPSATNCAPFAAAGNTEAIARRVATAGR